MNRRSRNQRHISFAAHVSILLSCRECRVLAMTIRIKRGVKNEMCFGYRVHSTWYNRRMAWVLRSPSPVSSPPGEDFQDHTFWFLTDSPANPAEVLLNEAADSIVKDLNGANVPKKITWISPARWKVPRKSSVLNLAIISSRTCNIGGHCFVSDQISGQRRSAALLCW